MDENYISCLEVLQSVPVLLAHTLAMIHFNEKLPLNVPEMLEKTLIKFHCSGQKVLFFQDIFLTFSRI